MDFNALLQAFSTLPAGVQAVCTGAAGELLARVVAGAPRVLADKSVGAVLARVYRQWKGSLAVDDEILGKAFEHFFADARTRDELEKVLRDQYEEVDFDVLEEELAASCAWAGIGAPKAGVVEQLETWVEDLAAWLEETPEYRERYGSSLQRALRDLGQREALIRNYSLARRRYLEALAGQHRHLRFAGMAEVRGPAGAEMASVFVTPRLAPEAEYRGGGPRAAREFQAQGLLTGEGQAEACPTRAVILGRPGPGKTTLMAYLALAMAQRGAAGFEWTGAVPGLLPVFYRVRDLDKDLEKHTTIWECMQQRCSQWMGATLPQGFFVREMKARGLLVLIDGLDEAASPARREHMVDVVSRFASGLGPESRIVITSRPFDYTRHRFPEAAYRHFELCEFNDEEIRTFIERWGRAHEPDPQTAQAKAQRLWEALERQEKIKDLARNALLLTMIARVHFHLGALPESRLGLYQKCEETLLEHWAEAAGLPPSPIDRLKKAKFLRQLAYEMQGEAGQGMTQEVALQIGREELAKRLERFLKKEAPGVSTEAVLDRLYKRDAILVQHGSDQFGFLHRSFQEYFAASWMAGELEEKKFRQAVRKEAPGWNETLYLAVARLEAHRRRRTLLELLERGRVEFALDCLEATAEEDRWLTLLVQFLARYYWKGQKYGGVSVGEVAGAAGERPELGQVLRGLFHRETRDGRALASAVELAEELARRGNRVAAGLIEGLFAEAEGHDLRSTEKMAWVDGFHIDRYLVTNRDYECMVPSHKQERDEYSDADDQPVIYVNWCEARLYSRWRGPGFRLPTEEEWEKAASWDPARKVSRKYPWGDEFDPKKCNTRERGPHKTTPVGAYPGGASAYGCYDMAGNVWEWTASRWSKDDPDRVVRGGSWDYYRSYAACAARYYAHPRYRYYLVGFRCART